MGIGRIIGGALTGLGKGLEQQTLYNMETERQQALEELRARNQAAAAQTAADLADRNNSRQGARQHYYKTEETEQEQGYKATDREDTQAHQLTLEQIKTKNDAAIENIRHEHKLSEDQANDVRKFAEEAKNSGTYIDRSEIMADGRMAVWTKDGHSRVLGTPGMFVPKGSSSDESGGTIADAAAARGGGIGGAAGGGNAPAPAPKAETKPTGQTSPQGTDPKAKALSELGTKYHLFEKNPEKYRAQYPGMFGPDGKLLPLAELNRRIQQGS